MTIELLANQYDRLPHALDFLDALVYIEALVITGHIQIQRHGNIM